MSNDKLEFHTFVGKAPMLTAAAVTEDNLDDIAKFVGADKYTIIKNLKEGTRIVEFLKEPENNSGYHKTLVRVLIGGYILTWPEGVSETGGRIEDRIYGIEKQDLDRFIAQKMVNEPIDPDTLPTHNYRKQF